MPFTLNKLPTSAHLILCGMPANCTDVLPSMQTNATVTFINLQKAVREMLEWLRRDVESATTVVQQLTNYLPGGKTIEMVRKDFSKFFAHLKQTKEKIYMLLANVLFYMGIKPVFPNISNNGHLSCCFLHTFHKKLGALLQTEISLLPHDIDEKFAW